VLVVSQGDDELLQLGGRLGWHFPRTVEGLYGGYFPADSATAIAHLEALRARGGEFLLFPYTQFWWLDHYGEFQEHLDTNYRRVWGDEHCVVYHLAAPEPGPASPRRAWPGPLQERDGPRVGEVDFGSLRRLSPISQDFGLDRGLPIDRYYIESFLARHANDVRGRVLEIEDNFYTKRFGATRVTQSDVLHAVPGNPLATIVADLTRADHIRSDSFDCIIFTQTMQYIYDVGSAARTLYRILKPGGVLLATMPGISQISRGWSSQWQWCFTTVSARQLFEEAFPARHVNVEAQGNVLAAIAFLEGLATDELRPQELDHPDPTYQVLITVRAVKPE
jgi:SAM-dependent methyltransferase